MRWGDFGAKLRNEMERAENTVVAGAQQLQGLAVNAQSKLEDSVAQAQEVRSVATSLPQNARREVGAGIDRVTQRLSPSTNGIEPANKSSQQAEEQKGIDQLDRKNLTSDDKHDDLHAFRADSV